MWRIIAAIFVGGLVGFIAQAQSLPAALTVFAIAVLGSLAGIEQSLRIIAQSMDHQFDGLRHLQRRDDDDEPYA